VWMASAAAGGAWCVMRLTTDEPGVVVSPSPEFADPAPAQPLRAVVVEGGPEAPGQVAPGSSPPTSTLTTALEARFGVLGVKLCWQPEPGRRAVIETCVWRQRPAQAQPAVHCQAGSPRPSKTLVTPGE